MVWKWKEEGMVLDAYFYLKAWTIRIYFVFIIIINGEKPKSAWIQTPKKGGKHLRRSALKQRRNLPVSTLGVVGNG